jgi:hypothetical protein
MFCEGVLNSRIPNRARAHTHRQVRALWEPLRLELPCRMHMLYLTRTGLWINHNFSNDMFITVYLLSSQMKLITKECAKYIYTWVSNRRIERELEILHCEGVLIPKVRPAHTYSISPWGINRLPREIEQQPYSLICIARLCVTSYSQPLINAKYLVTSKKLLVSNNKWANRAHYINYLMVNKQCNSSYPLG